MKSKMLMRASRRLLVSWLRSRARSHSWLECASRWLASRRSFSGRLGPFVAINCGALPPTLIQSELFGYRRGAFSDAREDRDGLVRRAHRGTLFLDEIAELPAESQVALLRVLQEGEVRPLGSAEPIAVDVRVVAATHQDIDQRIVTGQFRRDLYARLAGFQVFLPALRDRREDLGILIAGILRKIGRDAEQVTFHRQAARALFSYTYPLNIRELEQALRAAVIFSRGGQICPKHLPEAIRDCRPIASLALKPEDQALRERLHEILCETHGNIAAAARTLNKAPIQVRRWCRRFALDLASFRGGRAASLDIDEGISGRASEADAEGRGALP